MENKKQYIRITDEGKIAELYDRVLELFAEYDVTVYECIGVLESVKLDIMYGVDEDD